MTADPLDDVDQRPAPPSPVLWFYGADAVGKSSTGWEAYSQLVDQGTGAAYVDTDYLSFCSAAAGDPSVLVAQNLAAVWPNFASAGARCLVVSGVIASLVERRRFAAALPGCRLVACRLTAAPATIRDRIVRRRQSEADSTGAVLSPETLAELERYGDRSVQFAARLAAADHADITVATDDRLPAEVAQLALRRAGLLRPPGPPLR